MTAKPAITVLILPQSQRTQQRPTGGYLVVQNPRRASGNARYSRSTAAAIVTGRLMSGVDVRGRWLADGLATGPSWPHCVPAAVAPASGSDVELVIDPQDQISIHRRSVPSQR